MLRVVVANIRCASDDAGTRGKTQRSILPVPVSPRETAIVSRSADTLLRLVCVSCNQHSFKSIEQQCSFSLELGVSPDPVLAVRGSQSALQGLVTPTSLAHDILRGAQVDRIECFDDLHRHVKLSRSVDLIGHAADA